VYVPRAEGRPPELVGAVTYELGVRALPYVAILAPETAEKIWGSLFDRPLTLTAFPRRDPGQGEIDRPLLRRVRLLLHLAAALEAEPGGRAVLRGPRTLVKSIAGAAKAFELVDVVRALDRSCGPETAYRAKAFGEMVLLLPVEDENESNVAGVVQRLRGRSEAKRRSSARQSSGEMAELIGELKRLAGSGRPVSSSRES
jgi:hypothetical protein